MTKKPNYMVEKRRHLQNWCWSNRMLVCRRMQIDPYLSPCTKLKTKLIKDLNINTDTLNLIEEKVRSSLEHIDTGDNFLNRTPKAQTLRSTVNKWRLMNPKVSKSQRILSRGQIRGQISSLQNVKRSSLVHI